MKVEILSPDAHLFQGEAEMVTLPGVAGSFQIKEKHAALISSLQSGNIRVHNGSEVLNFPIQGGLIEVIHNNVIILV